MDKQLLIEIGLTEPQAKAYLAFIQSGRLSPSELATKIGEKRTNGYQICDQLDKLGIIEKIGDADKAKYEAKNPIALESLMENKRNKVHAAETRLKQNMPGLLSYYYSFTEKPGIKMVEGLEGLKSIYQDTLRAKQPIRLVRTTKEVTSLGSTYIDDYKAKRAKLGITTQAITPNVTGVNRDPKIDEANLFARTWVEPDKYSAPVEINIYGTKVAFSVFGESVMGVVVDSPDVALAMQQLFDLITEKSQV